MSIVVETNDNEQLPKKLKNFLLFKTYLMFFMMAQAILISLLYFADNNIEFYQFSLGLIMLLLFGIIGIVSDSTLIFHIEDKIKNGEPYFEPRKPFFGDKNIYRHLMVSISFFLSLIILAVFAFTIITLEDMRIIRWIFLPLLTMWIYDIITKRKSKQNPNVSLPTNL